tara:strand:- start:759 stop:1028 length:270 start_codon:yes stop_codon:yes gene_type:complete
MAQRIKILTADFDDKGVVTAEDHDGNEYQFKGEAYQELAYAATYYGSINPAKWDLIYDVAEAAAFAATDAFDPSLEYDEEAQYCTDNGI